MVFFWKGKGFLVVVILLVALAGFCVPFAALFTGNVFRDHGWLYAIPLTLAAVATWVVGRRLNRRPLRIYIDELTGQRVLFNATHTFCAIRMEFWAAPLIAWAAFAAIAGALADLHR